MQPLYSKRAENKQNCSSEYHSPGRGEEVNVARSSLQLVIEDKDMRSSGDWLWMRHWLPCFLPDFVCQELVL
jgi:hypothetical protein